MPCRAQTTAVRCWLIGAAAALCATTAVRHPAAVGTDACGPRGLCVCAAAGGLERADCSGANLAGVPRNLSAAVRSLDMSDNDVGELARDAFRSAGLDGLRTLTARNCSVARVSPHAFRGLEALVELDMSGNRVAALHPATFRYTFRLRKIALSGNPVRELSDGLFANLSSVREIELDGCQLTTVHPGAFRHAVRLGRLRLDGNRLANVAAAVLSSVPGLRSLDVSDNPWRCDCDLRPFRDSVILKKLYKPNVSCAEPEGLRGQLWSDIKPEEFFCKPVVVYPSQDGSLEFTDQAPWTISCKVYGDPTPKTQWLLNSYAVSNDSLGDYTLSESTVVNHTRWVNISGSKSLWSEPSEFKCTAINVGGSDERKITVVVKNTSKIDNEPSIPINVNSDSGHVLIISILVAGVVVVMIFIVFYTLYYRRRPQKPLSDTDLVKLNRLLLKVAKKNLTTGDNTSSDQPGLSLGGEPDTLTFPWDGHVQNFNGEKPSIREDDPWEVSRKYLKVCSLLGEGNFGQVWKCEATNDVGVKGYKEFAVKTLKNTAGERELLDLMQELEIMKTLEPHINVVKLLGCCSEKDPLLVIMEFVKFGKLQNVLRDSRGENYYTNMHGLSSLTSRDLINICYQISNGMDFLSSKGIVHRDLATRNVLVTDEWACKVSDFGFARNLDADSLAYERTSQRPLPVRWMAPESLFDGVCTVKSDVWSFGVLVWEVVTLGSTPYPGASAAAVMEAVRGGRRMDRPRHCEPRVYDVMRACWRDRADDRPDFAALRGRLGDMLAEDVEYVRLDDVRAEHAGGLRPDDDVQE